MARLAHKGVVVIYNEHTAKMIEVADKIIPEGDESVITSGRDGRHKKNSRHYKEEALDFRGRHIPLEDREEKIEDLQFQLGNRYLVLPSNDGAIHVQTA